MDGKQKIFDDSLESAIKKNIYFATRDLKPNQNQSINNFYRIIHGYTRNDAHCIFDNCHSFVNISNGSSEKKVSICHMTALIMALFGEHRQELRDHGDMWKEWRVAVINRNDMPWFVVNIAVWFDNREVAMLFPNLMDNIWLACIGDANWATTAHVSPLQAMVAKVLSGTVPVARLCETAKSKKTQHELAWTDSLILRVLGHFLVKGEVVNTAKDIEDRLFVGAFQTVIYSTLKRYCELDKMTTDMQIDVLLPESPDRFVTIRTIMDAYRWANSCFDIANATKPVDIVAEFHSYHTSPRGVDERDADIYFTYCQDTDNAAARSEFLRTMEDIKNENAEHPLSDDDMKTAMRKRFAIISFNDASVIDLALSLCALERSTQDNTAVPAPESDVMRVWSYMRRLSNWESARKCYTVLDHSVVCLVPRSFVKCMADGGALFSAVALTSSGSHIRLPVYPLLTGMFFSDSLDVFRWAVSVLIYLDTSSVAQALDGQRGIIEESMHMLKTFVPELISTLVGDESVFSLMIDSDTMPSARLLLRIVVLVLGFRLKITAHKQHLSTAAKLYSLRAAKNDDDGILKESGSGIEYYPKLCRLVKSAVKSGKLDRHDAIAFLASYSIEGFSSASVAKPSEGVHNLMALETLNMTKISRKHAQSGGIGSISNLPAELARIDTMLKVFACFDMSALRMTPSAAMRHHEQLVPLVVHESTIISSVVCPVVSNNVPFDAGTGHAPEDRLVFSDRLFFLPSKSTSLFADTEFARVDRMVINSVMESPFSSVDALFESERNSDKLSHFYITKQIKDLVAEYAKI